MTSQLNTLCAQLLDRHAQLRTLLEPVLDPQPLLAGSLYTLRRRCGKPSCRCARGQLHSSTVLSYRGQGRPQTISPLPDQLPRLQKLTDAYRRFRQARTQLVRLHHEVHALLDRIEAARIQQGEHQFQRLRSAAARRRSRTRSAS